MNPHNLKSGDQTLNILLKLTLFNLFVYYYTLSIVVIPISLVNDPLAKDIGALIGFGNFEAIDVGNPLLLDGIGIGNMIFDYAFVVPRDGTINSFAAYFRTLVPPVVDPATIRASIYQSSDPLSNSFRLVFTKTSAPTAPLATPNSFGTTAIPIPVSLGDKLFVLFDIDPSCTLE